MARTVPAVSASLRMPELERFTAGQPIVAGDAVTNTGRWLSVGLASNLAYAVDACGPAASMSWGDGQITGTYTTGGDMQVRLPVIGPLAGSIMARLRLRVWGSSTTSYTVTLTTATAGSVAVTVNGAFSRYPAPASPQILDVAADVVDGGDVGFYVDAVLTLDGDVGELRSVHLDWMELAYTGTAGRYLTASTTLPAGQLGNFVPADDAELATDSTVSADLLFDRRQQWPEQYGRRRVKLAWFQPLPAGVETASQYAHMAPVRLRALAHMPPAPVGQDEFWTVAVYAIADAADDMNVYVLRDDGKREEIEELARVTVPGGSATGWFMATFQPTLRRSLGGPQAYAGLSSLFVVADGAVPIDGRGRAPFADARQSGYGAATALRVQSVFVWGP
jgi:hypothetical protein